jgi:hypothetical protein
MPSDTWITLTGHENINVKTVMYDRDHNDTENIFIRYIQVSDSGHDFGESFEFKKGKFPMKLSEYDKFLEQLNVHIKEHKHDIGYMFRELMYELGCKCHPKYGCHNYHLDLEFPENGGEPYGMYYAIRDSGLDELYIHKE